jgi:hydroxymethylglutaryl-CoA reductase (NADPH)
MKQEQTLLTSIETRIIGPFLFNKMQSFDIVDHQVEVSVPLATYETTLFYSVSRGARVIKQAGGLTSVLMKDTMTRSVTLTCESVELSLHIQQHLQQAQSTIQKHVIEPQSRYAKLEAIQTFHVGRTLYVRLSFNTSNAAGHNMVTKAADHVIGYILNTFAGTTYTSVSGNICVDKKVSAINSLEGRGKHIISEVTIPREIVQKMLKTTPEKIVDLHIKKNLYGSIIAGSLQSANAHFANMLLATYLATGQDAANIVEGSQGITMAEVVNGDLYFSVNIPNIIVGTVGNGKHHPDIQARLAEMGCLGEGGSRRYAHLVAGVVLAGELSLLAALTNPNELMNAHERIERKK